MIINQSFNTSTDAIVHDSDPRLLNFKQWNSVTGVETKLGTSVDMGLFTVPAITVHPATTGPAVQNLTDGVGDHIDFTFTPPPVDHTPVIDDLTGGAVTNITFRTGDAPAVNPSNFQNLENGNVSITIQGSTLLAPSVTAIISAGQIKALAVAAGLGGERETWSNYYLDVTSCFDATALYNASANIVFDTPSMPLGRNFVNWSVGQQFTADNGTVTHFRIGVRLRTYWGGSYTDLTCLSAGNDSIDLTTTPSGGQTYPSSIGRIGVPNTYFPSESPEVAIYMRIDSTELQYIGPYSITAAQIKIMADAAGSGNVSDYSFVSTTIPWNLSRLIGHSIVSYTYDVSQFTAVPALGGSGVCMLALSYNSVTSHPNAFDGTGTGLSQAWSVTGWDPNAPIFSFRIVLAARIDPPTTVVYPIAASDLITLATAQGKLTQQDATLDLTVLGGWPIGWTCTSITGEFLHSYGPDNNDPPSIVQVKLHQTSRPIDIDISPPQGASGVHSAPAGSFSSPSLHDDAVDANFRPYVHVNLYPRSTAAYDTAVDVIMTEAYELRHRNQAAYRLICKPPLGWTGESPPHFNITGYGSQGLLGTPLEYWETVEMKNQSGAESYGMGVTFNIISGGFYKDLGQLYEGNLLHKTDYLGSAWPCNYMKFLLEPSGDSLTGWTLQILASAREL